MTKNQAAAEIRGKVLRKMSQLENSPQDYQWDEMWSKLREYIKGMAKRESAKPGGLGRR